MRAQLLVVTRGPLEPDTVRLLKSRDARVVEAPADFSRAAMCDLGMRLASGAIVAVRDDVDVGDARWLDAYQNVLRTPAPIAVPASTMVDSLVGGQVILADVARPAAPVTPAPRVGVAAIEMAAF